MSTQLEPTTHEQSVVDVNSTSAGRTSGKPWKTQKTATRRSFLPDGVKTKRWDDRMEKTKRESAIKKLENELKEEKQAEFTRRREVTLERKKAMEERSRIEEAKAKMGQRKAARLRRREGRSKKIKG